MDRAQLLDRLRSRAKYFENHIMNSELFLPEYKAATKVNDLLETLDTIRVNDAQKIIILVNELDFVEHYNGSGWYDYLIQLSTYLRLFDHKVEISNQKLYLL